MIALPFAGAEKRVSDQERDSCRRDDLLVADAPGPVERVLLGEVRGGFDECRRVQVEDQPGARSPQSPDQPERQVLRDDDIRLEARDGSHGLGRTERVRRAGDPFSGGDERDVEALDELGREPVIPDSGAGHLFPNGIRGPHDDATHSRIVPCPMRAVVVIPTLNARELLAEAIASVEAQTVPVQIIVVDNASSDGTAEMLADRFPQVTVVRNEENLGFGRAVNRGVAEAGDADIVILVNNDAVCAPDFVAQPARAVRGSSGRHGGRRARAGIGAGARRLRRDRARHDPRLVGLPLEPAGERTGRGRRPRRPLRRRSRVSSCPPSASSVVSTRRSSRTGRTSISRCGSGTQAGGASLRPARAHSTSTGRHWERRHPLRGGWRPSAGATCWRSTAWPAATPFAGRRSPRSTGRYSPST